MHLHNDILYHRGLVYMYMCNTKILCFQSFKLPEDQLKELKKKAQTSDVCLFVQLAMHLCSQLFVDHDVFQSFPHLLSKIGTTTKPRGKG